MDSAGNLLLADSGNRRIRVVACDHRHVLRPGHLPTETSTRWPATAKPRILRGRGPGRQSHDDRTRQYATVDGEGNILIADSGNFGRIGVVAVATPARSTARR